MKRGTHSVPGTARLQLKPGDELLLDANSSVSVKYGRELTSLWLSDSARARIEPASRGKVISLLAGSLSAAVAPQGQGAPLRILTPHGSATVLGTQFMLQVEDASSRLEVWKGRVRLSRPGETETVDVGAGQYAVAGPGIPLHVAPLGRGVLREQWPGARSAAATPLSELSCLATRPAVELVLPDFEAATRYGDEYVARFRGILRPTVSGQYHFWIAGDDSAELWLSPDHHAGRKTKICWTSGWTEPREWERDPTQSSAGVFLEAGRSYYIEALHLQTGGGESVAVAWAPPGGARDIIPGDYLVPVSTEVQAKAQATGPQSER